MPVTATDDIDVVRRAILNGGLTWGMAVPDNPFNALDRLAALLAATESSVSGGAVTPPGAPFPPDRDGLSPVETEAEQLQQHVYRLNQQLFQAIAERDKTREALGIGHHTLMRMQDRAEAAEKQRDEALEDVRSLMYDKDEDVQRIVDRAETAEAREAALRDALTDQCEMNEQSVTWLRQLHKEWPQMIHEETYDGEPVISEALRCIVDDLDTTEPRAALAASPEGER